MDLKGQPTLLVACGTRMMYIELLADAGYGGFEISMTPGYSAGVGAAWLEKGGIKVIANIRGGGEFGPSWHQAALKPLRYKAYEDFEAVARDLISRGYTEPSRLACIGGSNGGLLVNSNWSIS